MLRQPVRTGLLVLLLAAAAFSFVLRGVEYIGISGRVSEISRFYRAIGYLNYTGDTWLGDARSGAEIVSESVCGF